MSQLTLIRGLPGSGKSTLAKMIQRSSVKTMHYEADMFHMLHGMYIFDPSKVKKAHQWCQDKTRKSLEKGWDVVVSNTFTTVKEMDPYLKMPSDKFQIIECKGSFGSIHNVPKDVLIRMAERWENI